MSFVVILNITLFDVGIIQMIPQHNSDDE